MNKIVSSIALYIGMLVTSMVGPATATFAQQAESVSKILDEASTPVQLVDASVSASASRPTLAGLQGQIDSLVAGPDSGCYDGDDRYVSCGNGTVTDTVTGLVWMQDWLCLSYLSGESLSAVVDEVGQLQDGTCQLSDNSKPGDWRLPTREDWEKTNKRANELGCEAPILTDRAGTGCASYIGGGVENPNFSDPTGQYFITSSADEIDPSLVWLFQSIDPSSEFQLFERGLIFDYAWAVRDGGLPGPKGEAGNDGTNGTDGADGVDGIDGEDGTGLRTYIKTENQSVRDLSALEVLCDEGDFVISGGVRSWTTAGGQFFYKLSYYIAQSSPIECDSSGNFCRGWVGHVVCNNDCSNFNLGTMDVYAICASTEPD